MRSNRNVTLNDRFLIRRNQTIKKLMDEAVTSVLK